MPRVLIAGCGYTGQRLARRLKTEDDATVLALVASSASAARLAESEVVDEVLRADLDGHGALPAPPTVEQVYYFIPPAPEGRTDPRLARFLNWLAAGNALPRRILLISTSGVYGDCGGALVDETRPPAPVADRALRRFDAEQALSAWGEAEGAETVILRVAGIYGPGRLPVARLRKGAPMVPESEAPWTNRIHVDDLVTVCRAAMAHAPAGGLYNVSDGNPGNMTDYFNRVADALGLPRPPLIPLAEAEGRLSAGMLSYLRESRRLDNSRMLSLSGVTLRYPTLGQGLAASIG